MSDDTVWLFWEGPKIPYIELCAEIIRAHAPNVCRLDSASYAELRIEPALDLSRLRLNHQADVIRAALLHTYGGMWLDSDCIVFSDLQPFLDALRVCDYVGFRESKYEDSQLSVMVSRAGGRVITRHFEKVVQFMRSGRDPEWLDLSSWPMNDALAEENWQGYLQLDRRAVAPVNWHENDDFFVERSDAEHAEHFVETALCYVFYNVIVPTWFKRLSADEILAGRTFLSYLFRRALGM